MEIKDLLREKRIELGLTMKELAVKVGVSEGTISRWESGEISNMKRDKAGKLAEILGISPAVIMGWEEKQEYYLNPETAQIAQEVFDNPDLRILFDAARDVSPDNIKLAAEMLNRFKKTNPDG